MNNLKYNKKLLKFIFILIPIILLVSFVLLKNYIIELSFYFPKCAFYMVSGLYCPACGNTRCVLSLLHGDILSALKYNLTPVLIGFLLLMLYIEGLTYSFNKYIKLLPRNGYFWVCVFVFMFVYYIVRNIFDFMKL